MSEEPDFKTYTEEFNVSQSFYLKQISDRESKAFEYGLIVVKNATLTSGGALLSIPAIVALSVDLEINMLAASTAGVLFAVSLILALLGTYIVHINWTLHVEAWENMWREKADILKSLHLDRKPLSEDELVPKSHYSKSIKLTFWLPHVIAVSYLICLVLGFVNLYKSLGIS